MDTGGHREREENGCIPVVRLAAINVKEYAHVQSH